MDSLDSANFLSGGSRLLSQSPQFSFDSASSSSHTGPGGNDLSLSELYPDSRVSELEPQTQHHNPKSRTRPSIAQALGFGAPLDQSDDLSVLGALEEEDGEEREEEEDAETEAEADVTVRVGSEDAEKAGIAAQSREEKLQSDLFVLRQLNGAFAVYNDALREAQGGTEVGEDIFFFFFFSHTHYHNHKSVSPSNWNRQTHYLTNTLRFYPSPSRSRGSYSTSDGWAPRRYAAYPFLSLFALRHIHSGHRMKRSSSRRNANGKKNAVARKKSVDRRRSANRSGGRRRSSSVRCAKKWSDFNARRGIGPLLGVVAVCGVYAVRVHLCARVPQQEGAREQVGHFLKSNYAFPSSV